MKQQSHRRIARTITDTALARSDSFQEGPTHAVPAGAELPANRNAAAVPLISIVVTTYNRAICLESCLAQLTGQVAPLAEGLVEIIVSDNHSSDHTAAIVARYAARHGFVRRVVPAIHHPSAEENLFSAVPHCRGDYIWPYGDDDFLAAGAVEKIIALVSGGQYGFYLLNSAYVSTDGVLLAERLIRMSCPTMVLNMVELVQAAGLITIVASFNSTLLRRQELMAVDHAKYLGISPIYAHVAVYLAAFADKPCLVVNQQWMTLRAGTGFSAFRVLADKTRSATYLPWSNGLGRLLRQLEDDGFIPRDLIFNTLECSGEGQFWTWANLLHIYTEQLQLSVTSDREEDVITPELFLEFRSFFANGSPFVFEIFVRLEKVLRLIGVARQAEGHDGPAVLGKLLNAVPADVRERLHGMTVARVRLDLQEVRTLLGSRLWLRDLEGLPRLGRQGDFDLIRIGIWYYAVNRTAPAERFAGLRPGCIDPVQNYPLWIVARSLEELQHELSVRDQTQLEWAGQDYHGYKIVRMPEGVVAVAEPLAKVLNSAQLQSVARSDLPELVLHAENPSAMHHVIDTLLAAAPAGSSPVMPDLSEFEPSMLARYFDEAYYLRQYADAAERVAAGTSADALQDFLTHGAEGAKCPCIFINVSWYQSKYLDGATLPDTPYPFAYLHYLMVGQRMRASPSPLFDEAWYLSRYPEVRTMVLKGKLQSGFDHFYTRGRFEGFDPHEAFNTAWYLETYPKVAAALTEDEGDRMSAYEHFLRFGHDVKLQPHPSFSEEVYLSLNEDVRDGVETGAVESGWMHWLWNGKAEGRVRAA